jgi:hypothetical protein
MSTEFTIHKYPDRLFKMCVYEIYEHLTQPAFNFALACEIKNLKRVTEGLKLNSLRQLSVHAGDVNTMDIEHYNDLHRPTTQTMWPPRLAAFRLYKMSITAKKLPHLHFVLPDCLNMTTFGQNVLPCIV